MDDKTFLQRSASGSDLSAVANRMSALDDLRRYAATNAASQLAALSAAMRPAEAWRPQLEAALDINRGMRTAMERIPLADMHASTMRRTESSALEQFKRFAETSSSMSQFTAIGASMVARSKALEALLSPSAMAAKHLDDLTGTSALRRAVEQAAKWRNAHENLAGALERFQEPLSLSTARTLLESVARASECIGVYSLPVDTAELEESERTHAEVARLVDGVNTEISQALTLQDAVDQIVRAIQATKDSLHQRLLFMVFMPVLMMLVSAILTPVADSYVKKWLEGAPKQQASKEVKEAARQAVGDLRLLNNYRFVSAQTLTLKAAPKARAPVVAQLRFGQPVRVLETNRGFTLVACRAEDGEVELQGWVFSRYLRRFN